MPRHYIVFLLVACFGILFAGCSPSEPEKSFEDFTFTDEDLQHVAELVQSSVSGSVSLSVSSASSMMAGEDVTGTTSSVAFSAPAVDATKKALYDSLRVTSSGGGADTYRINNAFLNIRTSMSVGSPQVERLVQGDMVTVLEMPNSEWAKVRMPDGKEGYAALRYLAKVTTEQQLAQDKKQFEGKYFVDFAFVNLRKDPSAQAEKVGEIPGKTIIKPLEMSGEWAHVSIDGKEGYVSTQYLKPFEPVFLVRQEQYELPILHYRATDSTVIESMAKQIPALKAAGKKIVTLKYLYDLVLAQEGRDTRVDPNTVVLVVSGVNAKNAKDIGDVLSAQGVRGTLFLNTKEIGLTGITEKMVLTLIANGNDLQSEGHTGDDLRSLTDSQVMLELAQSKKLLEDITKREVYAIAYPVGGVNDRVMKLAADNAYLFGLTQTPDKSFTRSQFLRLPSLFVSAGMSPEDVVRLTSQ